MHITKKGLERLDQTTYMNIVNSTSGFKPANLIGTVDSSGRTNLAMFSSVFHLGSRPALIGFVMRSYKDTPWDTYSNIRENGVYTINHVQLSFVEKAHYTAVEFDKNRSEFEACRLTEAYIDDFKAPFVKESPIKMGLHYREEIPIRLNGTTIIIGEIAHVIFPDAVMEPSGHLNLTAAGVACVSGLGTYYKTEKVSTLPQAVLSGLPDFEAE
ncbi:MAG: flavin reductase [Bacteroidota bacterium]